MLMLIKQHDTYINLKIIPKPFVTYAYIHMKLKTPNTTQRLSK